MKYPALIFASLLFTSAGAQNFEWTIQSESTTSHVYPMGIAADPASHLFMWGYNYGTAGQLKGHPLTGNFLTRINTKTSAIDWCISLPALGRYVPDNRGGVLCYSNHFDHYPLPNDTIYRSENSTYAIIRYDETGQVDWYSTGNSLIYDLLVDDDENIYALFENPHDTIVYNGQEHIVPTPYKSTFLLESFTRDGNLRWSSRGLQQSDTLRFMSGMELALDAHGNVGAWTTAMFNAQPYQGSPTAIAKFSTAGKMLNYIEAFQFGSSHSDAYGLQFDRHNNIYVYTGYYSYDLSRFDSLYNDMGKIYLAGYMSNCTRTNFLIDRNDNTYLSASYHKYFDGDNSQYSFCGFSANPRGEINSGIHVLGGFEDNCKAFYTGSGKADDFIKYMCLDREGNVYAAGHFKSLGSTSADPPLAFGTHTLINNGQHEDLFVTKLTGPTNGVSESFVNKPLFVYPNPAGSSFEFTAPEDGQLLLYNVHGALVLTKPFNSGEPCKIETDQLGNGVYYAGLRGRNNTIFTAGKVIVRH